MRKTVSRIILITLLMGMLTLAFNLQPVKASGTIYIRANGSVDGTTSIQTGDNVTYVVTANINDPIVVQRNNIIIDGKGYTLQGAWNGTGIDLSIRTNVTVQNATIKAFNYGIGLSSSSNNNTISGNNITNNAYGVELSYSSNNNTISGNNITTNNYYGIGLSYSSNNNMISGNNITANIENGILLDQSLSNMISGNNITNNAYGVGLSGFSNNNMISGNNIANNTNALGLSGFSNNNMISGNNITGNNAYGILLSSSSNNAISGNSIANNAYGIELSSPSNNNMISGNNITANNRFGIWLYGPSNTTVSGNSIANNAYGIELSYSSNNAISGNNITANNVFGIELESASRNVIYHNNFIDNQQVNSSTSMNVWDDGYPSGGNYWSDYVGGVDEKSGPNQDQPGGDGIGDNPYLIDANNRDRYPLMTPTPVIPEFPSTIILTLFMTLTTLAVAFTKKRLLRHQCTGAFSARNFNKVAEKL